jgi:hypothetical protein
MILKLSFRATATHAAYTLGMTTVLWAVFTGAFTPGRNAAADVAPSQAVTSTPVSGDAVVAHVVAAISTARGCAPVQTWVHQHPGRPPASMVLKLDGTYQVSVVKWTYPAPPRMWTLAICTK